jgi:hypothetical protein
MPHFERNTASLVTGSYAKTHQSRHSNQPLKMELRRGSAHVLIGHSVKKSRRDKPRRRLARAPRSVLPTRRAVRRRSTQVRRRNLAPQLKYPTSPVPIIAAMMPTTPNTLASPVTQTAPRPTARAATNGISAIVTIHLLGVMNVLLFASRACRRGCVDRSSAEMPGPTRITFLGNFRSQSRCQRKGTIERISRRSLCKYSLHFETSSGQRIGISASSDAYLPDRCLLSRLERGL